MKKYHAVTLEAPRPKAYTPMDPKEKAEKIARMEARLASKIVLDNKGDFKGYGEPITDDCSAIDDARLDIWSTPKPVVKLPEPVQGLNEPNVAPDKNCVSLENGDCVSEVECMHTPQPVLTQEEFEIRLEKLYQQSEAFHKDFMAKFGPKE